MAKNQREIRVELRRGPPEILGRAVFGTADGLTVHGNGLLAGRVQTSGAFEFNIGRGRDRPLHTIGTDAYCLFRRQVLTDQDYPVELLGILGACRDRHGRPGFVGGCVAVERDTVKPSIAVTDWALAYDEASGLYDLVRGRVDQESGRLLLPPHNLLPATPEDRGIPLALDSSGVLILHNVDLPEDEVIRRMQAIAFMKGAETPTIIFFQTPVPGSMAITQGDYKNAVSRFENSVNRAILHRRTNPSSRNPSEQRQAGRSIESIFDPESGRDASRQLADLQIRLDHLELTVEKMVDSIRALEAEVYDDLISRKQRTLTARRTVSDAVASLPFWVWIGGAATLALLLVAILAFVVFRGDPDPMFEANPTEAYEEENTSLDEED